MTGGAAVNTTDGALVYDPYAYEIHEDPYPTYARLRDEAPLYRNDELDFWALSRHADVIAGFRDSERFSNAHGVSLDPAASGPHAHRTMSFLAMDPPQHGRMRGLVSRGFTPRRVAALEPRIRELAREHLDVAARAATSSTSSPTSPASCRWTSSPRCSACPPPTGASSAGSSDLLVHREEGVNDVPPDGHGRGARPGRLLRRHDRRAAGEPDRRPDLGAARGRDRRRPPDRRRDHRLPVPDGRGRQRDHHQAARATPGTGPGATPTSGPSRSPTPTASRLGRGDAALRHLAPDAGPDHDRGRRAARPGDPRGRPGAAARRLGQPRRAGVRRPRPLRPRPRPNRCRSSPASASAATSAWAPRWPGSRPGSRSRSWSPRVGDYDIDPAGTGRVHSVNVRGFAALPTSVVPRPSRVDRREVR